MSQVYSYNAEKAAAADAGGGEYITESCVARGFIESAKWTTSNSGAKALELSFESEKGLKANYLSLYYQKKDGSINEVGDQQIHALMGAAGVQGLSQVQQGHDLIAPELVRKPIQLALERENYTKNDGSAGYRFQIKCFMSARTGQTVSEQQTNQQPESAGYWTKRFAQNPQGKAAKQTSSGGGQYGGYATESYTQDSRGHYQPPQVNQLPPDALDDEIPF